MTEPKPAPPPTTHADDRELGFGAANARPDIGDSEAGPGALDGPSGAVAAAGGGGKTPADDDDHADGPSGVPVPNATSSEQATHDRAS